MASSWVNGDFNVAPMRFKNPGYDYMNAVFYYIFGHNTLIMRVINGFIASFSIILVFKIAYLLFEERIARTSAVLMAFFPNLVFWSSLHYRDIILAFLTLVGIYQAIRIFKERTLRWSRSFILVSSVTVLYYFRTESAFVISLLLIGYLLINSSRLSKRTKYSIVISTVGIIALIFYSFLAIQPGTLESLNLYGADFLAAILEGGNTQNLTSLIIPGEVIKRKGGFWDYGLIRTARDVYKLPITLLFVLISPFPPYPDSTSIASNIWQTANIGWLILVPFTIIGFYVCCKEQFKATFPILSIASLHILFLAIMLIQLSLRGRVQVMPLLLLLAGVGWHHRANYKSLIYAWLGLLTGLIFIYGLFEYA